jgi:hypothetical protein
VDEGRLVDDAVAVSVDVSGGVGVSALATVVGEGVGDEGGVAQPSAPNTSVSTSRRCSACLVISPPRDRLKGRSTGGRKRP